MTTQLLGSCPLTVAHGAGATRSARAVTYRHGRASLREQGCVFGHSNLTSLLQPQLFRSCVSRSVLTKRRVVADSVLTVISVQLACSLSMVVCCRPHSTRRIYRAGTVAKAQAAQKYDYDLVIVGAGVGGHGAAMHAIESVSHLTPACSMCNP